MTDDDNDWFEQIVWNPCPSCCTCGPQSNPGLDEGHITDQREDGTAVRFHNRPVAPAEEAVQAIELEIETCTKVGRPVFGEPRFVVDSDRGQYLRLTAASAASGIIRQALTHLAAR